MAVGFAIQSLSRSSTSVVTVTTAEPHQFVAGDKIRLFNVLGGGTAFPFMAGNPYTVGTVTETGGTGVSRRFTYTQTGATASADMVESISISSGTQYASSLNRFQIVTSSPHNLTTAPRIRVKNVSHSKNPVILDRINCDHRPENVEIVNSTTLIITMERSFTNWAPEGIAITWTTGTLEWIPTGATVALDDGINTITAGRIGGVGISSTSSLGANRIWRVRSEATILRGVMKLALQSKGIDYAFLRLFDVTDFSRLTNSPIRSRINLRTSATTLRGILDALVEAYQGTDGKARRYYVNLDGQLVYEVSNDVKPATPNAPYKVITATVGSPNNSTTPATVNPYALKVEWDHDTTKRALFETASRNDSPIADLIKFDSPDALGTAFSRPGAPYFDEILDYPNNGDDRLVVRQQAAKGFFLERYAPILRGSMELRGAGTATWNSLGFSSGYAEITVPTGYSITPSDEIAIPARRTLNEITFTTFPFAHNLSVGMSVLVAGVTDGGTAKNAAGTAYNGSYVVTSVPSGTVFTYSIPAGGGAGTAGYNYGNVTVTTYPSFIRTGTAPNQIVTATYPFRHGIANGATTTISGLTSTAGTSMNGTVTATVTSDYVFTYPSTGTNGTATGTATVTAISLVPRWEPGQWVSLAAENLGSSALYRVEEVSWRLEPGSYQQVIGITFNRRPTKTITKIIKEKL